MSLLAEVSIFPLDKGESVGDYVARSIGIIEKSGLAYKVGAMGTCIEGEWDEVMGVIKACFEALRRDCHRVEIQIKADYRAGRSGCLEGKVRSVEKRLGHAVCK
ncbi:MAG: MTH1187 family thiamine-binding protein [Candidatus Omnitrophica bacterium]|nr:MTH1187 family thiamine-binding protein [Candidatus Omnitrophota bacterium]